MPRPEAVLRCLGELVFNTIMLEQRSTCSGGTCWLAAGWLASSRCPSLSLPAGPVRHWHPLLQAGPLRRRRLPGHTGVAPQTCI